MSKHWPKPWTWDGKFPAQLVDAEDHIICEMMPSSAESNMSVLAAAPDMLFALSVARDFIVASTGGSGKTLEFVSAVIAKAEGR